MEPHGSLPYEGTSNRTRAYGRPIRMHYISISNSLYKCAKTMV